MSIFSSSKKAFLTPFATFLVLLGVSDFAGTSAKYWVYPAQTLLCGILVARYWPRYRFKAPAHAGFALFMAALVFLAWISPQEFFGVQRRFTGFDPAVFQKNSAPWFFNLAFRFARLVVVVPLIEEIFWRGFLLRYLIRDDFENVPVGAFSWLSFAVVTAGFCFEHQRPDWPAALIAGAAFNAVAYRTRSLSACVLAHAATNLLLGIYILRTGQWGFW